MAEHMNKSWALQVEQCLCLFFIIYQNLDSVTIFHLTREPSLPRLVYTAQSRGGFLKIASAGAMTYAYVKTGF